MSPAKTTLLHCCSHLVLVIFHHSCRLKTVREREGYHCRGGATKDRKNSIGCHKFPRGRVWFARVCPLKILNCIFWADFFELKAPSEIIHGGVLVLTTAGKCSLPEYVDCNCGRLCNWMVFMWKKGEILFHFLFIYFCTVFDAFLRFQININDFHCQRAWV